MTRAEMMAQAQHDRELFFRLEEQSRVIVIKEAKKLGEEPERLSLLSKAKDTVVGPAEAI